jgi:hypothetical protein
LAANESPTNSLPDDIQTPAGEVDSDGDGVADMSVTPDGGAAAEPVPLPDDIQTPAGEVDSDGDGVADMSVTPDGGAAAEPVSDDSDAPVVDDSPVVDEAPPVDDVPPSALGGGLP